MKKLKDYEGNNINEKLFLDNLFKKRYSYYSNLKDDDKNIVEVTSDDLRNNFYITVDKIIENMSSKNNFEKIFEVNSINKNFILNIFITIIFFIITIVPLIYNYDFFAYLIFGLFGAIGIYLLIKGIICENYNRTLCLCFGLFFIFFMFPFLSILINDTKYLFGYIYGIIVITCIIFIGRFISKRTQYGNEMLGKIRGFRRFLKIVKKDKLESMVIENPNYFYDILPYTYVLGISKKWIEKFESISMQSPTWYNGSSGFNVSSFGSFMNSTMKSAGNAMTSKPSSGSGSSGGGSSGGGSGGGGGGSW